MGKLIDLTGQRFGRLTVISRCQNPPNNYGQAIWNCVCDCGNKTLSPSQSLRRGESTSCGCHAKEILDTFRYKHGDHQSRLYNIWTSIKQRCLNPNCTGYPFYGGRGITLYDEWAKDYAAFRDYMGEPPSEHHSVDRINNDGHYEPGNVRWATRHEQGRNKRTNQMITHNGKTQCFTDWVTESGVPYATLHWRIFTAKWPLERALTALPKTRNSL